jgi:hypothetical protein
MVFHPKTLLWIDAGGHIHRVQISEIQTDYSNGFIMVMDGINV